MATKKESKPVITKEEYIVTDWDKEEKEGGKKIEIKKPFKAHGQKELNMGGLLVECNDGFFNVYNPVGKQLHYRVGEKIIKQIMEQEQS